MIYGPKKVTTNLRNLSSEAIDGFDEFRRVPLNQENLPFWRVKFTCLNFPAMKSLGLDINGEIILGVLNDKNIINLSEYDNGSKGVSRRHLKIQIAEDNLVVIDLKSTNGTRLNGEPLIPGKHYSILDGSVIALGDLFLAVEIIQVPREDTLGIHDTIAVAKVLTQMAAVMTSQLTLDDVFTQILKIIHTQLGLDEISIWLIDENSGELELQACHGSQDDFLDSLSVSEKSNPFLEKVKQSSEILTLENIDKFPKKFVEGSHYGRTFYIPIIYHRQVMGVLYLLYKQDHSKYSHVSEQLLMTIGQFFAIAVHNSREYEISNRRLERKIRDLEIINRISQAFSKSTKLRQLYDLLKIELCMLWDIKTDGLWLKDKISNKLIPFPQPSYHCIYEIGETVIGEVAKNLQPYKVEGLSLCSVDNSKDAIPVLEARSSVIVPLVIQNELIGVYGVFSDQDDEFAEEDIEILQALAEKFSLAIQKIQLFEFIEGQWATVKAAINMLPHPIMVIDPNEKLTLCNDAFESILDEIMVSLGNIETEDPKPISLVDLIRDIRESEWNRNEIRIGDKIFTSTTVHASLVGTIILLQDITDPITGGVSWLHFQAVSENIFQQSIRYKKPLVSVVLKINNLPKIIDGSGYAAGDQAIKMLSDFLHEMVRTTDLLVRYCKDEFVMLMPETNLENAKVVVERIEQGLAEKQFSINNKKTKMKLNIAINELDLQKDKTFQQLIDKSLKKF